jgi:hypothetical protein
MNQNQIKAVVDGSSLLVDAERLQKYPFTVKQVKDNFQVAFSDFKHLVAHVEKHGDVAAVARQMLLNKIKQQMEFWDWIAPASEVEKGQQFVLLDPHFAFAIAAYNRTVKAYIT